MNGAPCGNDQVTVLYDPLCGWCYGATPSLRRLAAQPGVSVRLLPTGLFAGVGARPMNDRFAAYAWASDQRIQQLTGQPFSARYREHVLHDRQALLDSGPATAALTAVTQTAPEQELHALEAIQAARYVDGKDVTSPSVLAELLREVGLAHAAERITRPTAALEDAVATRTAAGRNLLAVVGSRGVPTVVVTDAAGSRVVPNGLVYGRLEPLMQHVRSA